ncbi:FAD-dependent oxidoreductase [Methanorbis rubei]|uniref:Dihydrolipoyl dehydrogenase n=1 Tax=Methanorbis rubei TaxID=3028300 RepID=A0AAE4MEE4_9EURY|nr:Dihydrolipoyl dehydrogenase [Methanocorpusculaceae archaeon Cs1]
MIYIVGGGPAGRMAAVRLASAGKEVTLFEKRALGGQCVHDGCMLVCGLNDVARSIRDTEFLRNTGVIEGTVSVRYPEVMRRLEEVQARLSKILERETLDAGVKIQYGVTAEVEGRSVIADGVRYDDAEAVIVASGAEMYVPDVSGAGLFGTYTARTIRSMPALPKRMAIVGGGISAAEFAYIFSSFGVEVSLFARSSFLSMLPKRMHKAALRDLSSVHIYENAPIGRVLGSDHVVGVVAGDVTVACDAVLFATGVRPHSPHVRGFLKNADGSIVVNEKMETSVRGVYACGDVVGAPYFTPVSRLQGFAAADAILGVSRTVDLSRIPFTVVLGLDYTVCRDADASGASFASPNIAGPGSVWHVSDGSVGTMELNVDTSNGQIVGFSSSGPGTGLVGTYLGYLVRKGVTVHEFSSMLEIHPISDGLYSMIRFAEDHLADQKRE